MIMTEKLRKLKVVIFVTILAFAEIFLGGNAVMPEMNVQAASVKTMKTAYQEYLKEKVSGKKYFKIVNIGENDKPALLIGKKKGDKASRSYTSCTVYYYKNGKVKKLGSLSGGRYLRLSYKNKQNYLTNGGSDFSRHVCVKKGKLYRYEYYNNHNWKTNPGDKWKPSVVKAGKKIIRNYGYLEADQYNAKRDSYIYKDTGIHFMKNTAKNREKI